MKPKINFNPLYLFTVLCCIFQLFPVFAVAGRPTKGSPKQEVRAVWITTVLGLDWPKSKKTDEQKSSLLRIIEKADSAKFNTLFFQIRGRADAMYRSNFEPWSHMLAGELGKDPGWDPLRFVVEEGHKRGMEVHAWFNTFLIKSGAEKPKETKPRHIILEHPEWLKLVKNEWWLDPGIPEARAHILTVAMDIVRNYDIDGFQFDFMRYTSNGFPDDATWKKYGKGIKKEDWRRDNINRFVADFYDSARAVKPMLKIGSTPIGIYNAVAYKKGLLGFDDVYQDAKAWLRTGTMDYIAPQVYWSLKDTQAGPDYAIISKDWIDGSSGRHIYIGIGAYKDDVFRQIPALIDTERVLGGDGQAYFRYENIERMIDSIQLYSTIAIPPPMKWKDSVVSNPPAMLTVNREEKSATVISWQSPRRAQDGDVPTAYLVYRSSLYPVDIDNPGYLLKKILAPQTKYTDAFRFDSSEHYHYAVTALDKGNNESEAVQEEPKTVPEVLAALAPFQDNGGVKNIIVDKREELAFIFYSVKEAGVVNISLWDAGKPKLLRSIEQKRFAGRNISTFSLSEMPKGEYILKIKSSSLNTERKFAYK